MGRTTVAGYHKRLNEKGRRATLCSSARNETNVKTKRMMLRALVPREDDDYFSAFTATVKLPIQLGT